MLPFRKILFPVDYSEPCRAVIPYVREVARHFSAQVTLVHAYPPIILPYGDLAVDPILPGDIRQFEETRLKKFAIDTFPGLHVETFAEPGEAGSVVHKIVEHQGTDLVMIGTHGYGPARRFLLGSIAAKVLHDVSVAVWTSAGSAASHPAATHYKCVLCALDESEEAETVLAAAAAVAAEYKARLSLVHVMDMPASSANFDFGPGEKEMRDDADCRLRELKDQLGIDAPHAVIDGAVAEGVQQEAIRRNADLIVTGRGLEQGTISRLWSRLYPIIRESPCPVLSI
jgi:nucleotide-binding universal stress UspA family protein